MDNLRPFNMFCSVRRDCLETGCVIIIHCTSQFEILPDHVLWMMIHHFNVCKKTNVKDILYGYYIIAR